MNAGFAVHHEATGQNEFLQLLSNMDLLVVPSRYESFGKVAMEAASAGTLVVASDIPGLRDIVEPGVSGFLVPPEDPISLAETVRRCVELRERNPIAWEGMRAAARKRSERLFSESANGSQVDAWLDIITRATKHLTPRGQQWGPEFSRGSH